VSHHADGTTSRLKGNALGRLTPGKDASGSFGWASFDGRATYTTLDAGRRPRISRRRSSTAARKGASPPLRGGERKQWPQPARGPSESGKLEEPDLIVA
jgi:hypothetical protein